MLHTDRAGPKKGIVCKLPGVRRDMVILIARELQSLKGRGTGHPHSQGATVLEATVLEGEGNAPTSTQNMHKPPEYPIMDQTESGKRVTGVGYLENEDCSLKWTLCREGMQQLA